MGPKSDVTTIQRGEQHLLGRAGDARTSGGWLPGAWIQIACASVEDEFPDGSMVDMWLIYVNIW